MGIFGSPLCGPARQVRRKTPSATLGSWPKWRQSSRRISSRSRGVKEEGMPQLRASGLLPQASTRHRRRPGGRALHQHESRPLQVLDQALRGDPGHHVVGVVDAPAAVIAQRAGEGVGDLVRGGGAEPLRVVGGMRATIAPLGNGTRTCGAQAEGEGAVESTPGEKASERGESASLFHETIRRLPTSLPAKAR